VILITGATGNVGRQVVTRLLAAGQDVRALTRNPAKAALPAAVEVVQGDLAEPKTHPAALEGVRAAFLFAVPDAAPAFLTAAKAAGVERVVFLSSGSVQDGVDKQPNAIAGWHAEIEDAIRDSGLQWTLLRPHAFAANALQWAEQLRAGDVIRGAYAQAVTAPIHEADIAAVGALALVEDGHAGAVHELTGPESLTHADQAQIIGEVLGRPVRYEELDPAAVRAAMIARHIPASIADTLLELGRESLGKPARVTATVDRITGHPARTFAQWVADRRADLT